MQINLYLEFSTNNQYTIKNHINTSNQIQWFALRNQVSILGFQIHQQH